MTVTLPRVKTRRYKNINICYKLNYVNAHSKIVHLQVVDCFRGVCDTKKKAILVLYIMQKKNIALSIVNIYECVL